MAGFRKFKGLNIKYSHRDPQKALPYPEQSVLGCVGCSLIEEPKNEEKTSHPKITAKSRIWRTETPEPIDTKFCISSAVHDIIARANFCEDRLRGFSVAKGRILAFSIDLLRRH